MTLFTALIEPVALLGWMLLLGAVIVYRAAGKGLALRAFLPAAATYYLLTTPLGANALIYPLEQAALSRAAECPAASPPSVVVVLTGGASRRAVTPDDYGELSHASLRRAIAAAELTEVARPKLLIVSGAGPGRVPEASLMGRFLHDLRVPADEVLIEDKSQNTRENALEVARIAEQRGLHRVLLVTSAAHMPRALRAFAGTGVQACARPADFSYVPMTLPYHFIPHVAALNKSSIALHEYLGLLRDRIL